MHIANALRSLNGYVYFRAKGGFCERFINLCSLEGAALWNLKNLADGIEACTTAKSYLRLGKCAVKSGMRLKVIRRCGLPFFLRRHRERAGVLAGLCLFFAVIALLSLNVWTIEVNGNSTVSTAAVLETLKQAGLQAGTPKSEIDAAQIRFYTMGHLPQISYVSVNRIGCCVEVQITERVENPTLKTDTAPCDVVSSMDGQIKVLEVYQGTKMYSAGEAVRKGNVLAAGFVELSNGTAKLRRARAYAVISAQKQLNVPIAQPEPPLRQAWQEEHITLHFFGIDIPLFIKGNQKPSRTTSAFIFANGVQLPIGYTKESYISYEAAQPLTARNEIALTATENYFLQKLVLLAGSKVTEESISKNAHFISAKFTAEFSAGVAQNMLLANEQ